MKSKYSTQASIQNKSQNVTKFNKNLQNFIKISIGMYKFLSIVSCQFIYTLLPFH